MELVKPGTNIDFIGRRKKALVVSLFAILAGLISLIAHGGPRLGVDFAGGTNVTVKFLAPVAAESIRDALGAVNLHQSTIQQFEEAEKYGYLPCQRCKSDILEVE